MLAVHSPIEVHNTPAAVRRAKFPPGVVIRSSKILLPKISSGIEIVGGVSTPTNNGSETGSPKRDRITLLKEFVNNRNKIYGGLHQVISVFS
ncbi:hypothetical protein Glove_313g63 [Diversispora epigaea]|uniref:Uncharacterized protein n=1 Tax=Diversispora epigaea TaxID=1348612 RepID=A0A397HWQ1_9GLOM|nr:hypothetical protein Glove_313g63 [Diversispora epigaea]